MKSSSFRFQVVREVPEPLGLFFRPGRADHTTLNQLVSENRIGMTGAVFDPCHAAFQETLRSGLWTRDLYTVLDPLAMEIATTNGFTPQRSKLPWAGARPHRPADFDSKTVDRMAAMIAEWVSKHDFNAVLAPCHYIERGIDDPWLLVDRRLTTQLRMRLDEAGCKEVAMYYPLATSTKVFFNGEVRNRLADILAAMPLDGVWLRIHPIGSQSGDTVMQHYILGCQDFHRRGLSLTAEKTGALGLALLAFGAVSAIESGISSGEQFNFRRLIAAPKKGPVFSARPRVYVSSLGTFLSRKDAVEFFANPKFIQYACRDTDCCRRGHESMTTNPRRHFANTKMEEIALLGATPERLRPDTYLQRIVRPAGNNLTRVLASSKLSEVLRGALERKQRRLHGWDATLTELNRSHLLKTFCPPLKRHILHTRATA